MKAKKYRFPIEGRNAEKNVNERIQGLMDFRNDRLAKVIFEDNEISLFIEHFPWRQYGFRKRVIAKQFSKKKYASCDEGVKKFVLNCVYFNWREVCRIEQEKYWLVIFEERR